LSTVDVSYGWTGQFPIHPAKLALVLLHKPTTGITRRATTANTLALASPDREPQRLPSRMVLDVGVVLADAELVHDHLNVGLGVQRVLIFADVVEDVFLLGAGTHNIVSFWVVLNFM